MNEHTKEPWKVISDPYKGINKDRDGNEDIAFCSIESEYGEIIYAGPFSFRALRKKANAHRIVAAVNAVEGILTEALKDGVIRELIRDRE